MPALVGTRRAIVGAAWWAPGALLDYDFRRGRYFGPALVVSRASSSVVANSAGGWSSVGTNAMARSDLGLQVEESRTNSNRNPRAVGAVAGSPGTLPTNWSQSAVAGIGLSVVGTGTENGVDYVDLRWSGTNTSGATGFPGINFETTTNIAATSGQTWSISAFLKLAAGSTTNIGFVNIGGYETTSGGVFVRTASATIAMPAGALARPSTTQTLSGGGTTASFQPGLFFSVANGAAVDITLRIGWPQTELGAFTTSPILPGAGVISTATRAVDVVTAILPVALVAGTLVAIINPQAPMSFASSQGALSLSNGTTSQRATLFRAGTTGLASFLVNPPNNTVTAGSALATGTRHALAATFANADRAVSANGSGVGTSTTAGADPSGMTQVQIGLTGGGGAPLNGLIERVIVLPGRRPNADVQALAQLASWGG